VDKDVRSEVSKKYAQTAKLPVSTGCGCGCGCGPQGAVSVASEQLGYDRQELSSIPEEADMGLGCGNPTAIAGLRPGETVVDLGSGGGIDCFLAAGKVGPTGKVIGVDMTREMIDRARKAAGKSPHTNVEFRLGEIENLPVRDGEADVIISNCVINLSPDKGRVFREAFRALKPGGRLLVSDIVLSGDLPEKARSSMALWASCVSGAVLEKDYLGLMKEAGFEDVSIVSRKGAADLIDPEQTAALRSQVPDLSTEESERLAGIIQSVSVKALKRR
jgi:arsenite methyltransferase